MSDYKPTEYVVDFGDDRSNQFVRLNMALIEQNSAKLRERIVRCCDCRYYQHNNFPRCDLYSIAHEVEPDGFCAWGERKRGAKVDYDAAEYQAAINPNTDFDR